MSSSRGSVQVVLNPTNKNLKGLKVPLASPESLIVMKCVASRPRDIADVENLLKLYPKLDVKEIEHWLKQFSEVMESPELLTRFQKMLTRK